MAKNQSAQSGQITPIPFEVFEARERLRLAAPAFAGFMSLLGSKDGGFALDAKQLFSLLLPIQGEVSAALNELEVVNGGAE